MFKKLIGKKVKYKDIDTLSNCERKVTITNVIESLNTLSVFVQTEVSQKKNQGYHLSYVKAGRLALNVE